MAFTKSGFNSPWLHQGTRWVRRRYDCFETSGSFGFYRWAAVPADGGLYLSAKRLLPIWKWGFKEAEICG